MLNDLLNNERRCAARWGSSGLIQGGAEGVLFFGVVILLAGATVEMGPKDLRSSSLTDIFWAGFFATVLAFDLTALLDGDLAFFGVATLAFALTGVFFLAALGTVRLVAAFLAALFLAVVFWVFSSSLPFDLAVDLIKLSLPMDIPY